MPSTLWLFIDRSSMFLSAVKCPSLIHSKSDRSTITSFFCPELCGYLRMDQVKVRLICNYIILLPLNLWLFIDRFSMFCYAGATTSAAVPGAVRLGNTWSEPRTTPRCWSSHTKASTATPATPPPSPPCRSHGSPPPASASCSSPPECVWSRPAVWTPATPINCRRNGCRQRAFNAIRSRWLRRLGNPRPWRISRQRRRGKRPNGKPNMPLLLLVRGSHFFPSKSAGNQQGIIVIRDWKENPMLLL